MVPSIPCGIFYRFAFVMAGWVLGDSERGAAENGNLYRNLRKNCWKNFRNP